MKAVVSNRIQLQGDAVMLENLERELTYSLPPRMPQDPPMIIKTIRPLREGLVSIPVGRLDLVPEEYEIIDKRVQAPMVFPEFKFELRASQQEVYDAVDDNSIINAWVSWGKTFTGLAIAAKLGQNVLKPPKENYMTPEIDVIKSEIRFLDGSFTPWAERINHLATNEEYIHSVALIASTYAAEGHKVLVVSDRVAFLKVCQRLVGENSVCITGDMDFTEREDTMRRMGGDKNILFGTQSIFSEGISLDVLSCLVLGTPVNNEPLLTQLIGRVIRKKEGKIQPKIVDIHLKGKTAARQANARMGYYVKQDYKINIK